MQDLLFLAHRIPFPPNKGDKIRSWNILRYLAKDYRLYLGCFVDDPADLEFENNLRDLCADCHFAGLDPRRARLRSLGGLVTGKPLSLGYYRDRAFESWVSTVLARRQFRQVFVFSSSMAQYARRAKIGTARLVVDFVDVDSDKWRQFSEAKTGPAGWIYGREGRTLLAFEREVAAEADVSIFVSAHEADLFRRLAPECAAKVRPVNNGVDFEYFDPDGDYPDPFRVDQPMLVFTGAMDYWANVDAVCWFAREILPKIRMSRPDMGFCIVGSKPAPAVRELTSILGVTVTGSVPDIRPYVAHATAVVAPLRLARGVQNKVLEAMAMAKAVFASPEALVGIDADPGNDVFVADGADLFAAMIVDKLTGADLADVGRRARARVIESYGWAANLAVLKEIFEESPLG